MIVAAALALLLAPGCGEDTSPGTAIELPDAGAADTTDGSEDADATDPDAGDADDATTDDGDADQPDAAQDVEQPVDDTVVQVCATYCAKLSECGQPFGGTDECPTACADNVAKDAGWLNSYLCAAGAQCAQISSCTATAIPTNAECEALCEQAEACHLFPSVLLGGTQLGCTVNCSVQSFFNAGNYSAFLSCAKDAISSCSDADITNCNEALGEQQCDIACKGGYNQQGTDYCNVVPEGFADEAECQAACDGWTPAQRWIARFCVGGFNCGPGMDACFPPPTESLDGAEDACASAYALCGGVEGFGLPKDPAVCGWIMTGIALGPNLGLDGAAECIDQFGTCPDQPNLIYGCMAPAFDGCDAYCGKLKSCGAPASEFVCQQQCKLGHVYNPEATETAIECVLAKACNELASCFQNP